MVTVPWRWHFGHPESHLAPLVSAGLLFFTATVVARLLVFKATTEPACGAGGGGWDWCRLKQHDNMKVVGCPYQDLAIFLE